MPAVPSSKRRGFTLVELLVVIGIIAVLIGILLPALNSARRSAATVACLSNLRQLAYAFQMYAGSNRNALPVIRQDNPDFNNIPGNTANGEKVTNVYWTDQLLPYAMPGFKTIFAWTSPEDGVRYKKSPLWCPTWAKDREDIDPYKNPNTDRFRTGYAPNQWPTFRPDYPAGAAFVPAKEANWRGNGSVGRYFKKSEYVDPSNHLLIAESNFWFIGFSLTDAKGTLSGQNVDINTWFTSGSPVGSMNIDRFRHGKYPSNNGAVYATTGGLVKYNIMYADGHANTSSDPADAYRGIRMRYP